MADVVLPAPRRAGARREGTVTNSERRVQRVRKALDAARRARATTSRSSASSRAGWAATGASPTAEEVWNELRALCADARRHELRAARGARRPPVAVPRRDASRRARSCTAASGRSRSRARGRRSRRSSTSRRSTRSTTSSRSGSPPAGGSTRTTPACRRAATRRRCGAARRSTSRPRTRERSASREGERVRDRLAARRGRGAGARRPDAAPGPGVHDAPLPGRGGDQPADHRRHRSEVGHRRVQGHARSGSRRSPAPDAAAGATRPAEPDGPSPARSRPDRRRARGGRRACSGRRDSGGTAASGGRRATGHVARGGHAARARRHLLLPALHAVQARVGWISEGALNYVCQRLDRAAGRGLRRRHVLRAVLARRRGRRASSTSATTSPAGRGRRRARAPSSSARSGPAGEHPARNGARDLAAQPVPRALRAGAGGARRPRPGEPPRERAIGAARPPAIVAARSLGGQPRRSAVPAPRLAAARASRACGCCAASARVDPDEPRRLPRARRLRRRCAARSSSGPTGVIREVTDVEARGPRRRRLPDRPQVGGRRAGSRRGRTTSSATPTSPSPARSRTAS